MQNPAAENRIFCRGKSWALVIIKKQVLDQSSEIWQTFAITQNNACEPFLTATGAEAALLLLSVENSLS